MSGFMSSVETVASFSKSIISSDTVSGSGSIDVWNTITVSHVHLRFCILDKRQARVGDTYSSSSLFSYFNFSRFLRMNSCASFRIHTTFFFRGPINPLRQSVLEPLPVLLWTTRGIAWPVGSCRVGDFERRCELPPARWRSNVASHDTIGGIYIYNKIAYVWIDHHDWYISFWRTSLRFQAKVWHTIHQTSHGGHWIFTHVRYINVYKRIWFVCARYKLWILKKAGGILSFDRIVIYYIYIYIYMIILF
jgi:hypothetical protein